MTILSEDKFLVTAEKRFALAGFSVEAAERQRDTLESG
jgi:hypothetical protein